MRCKIASRQHRGRRPRPRFFAVNKISACLGLSGLLTLLCFEPVLGSGPAERDLSGWIGVSAMDFDVKEFDRQGQRLVHESGWLPGIEAGVAASVAGIQWRLQSALYDGDVDYDGQTQANVPVSSTTDQRIWNSELNAAYSLPLQIPATVNLTAGIGYRDWERNIQSVGAILGLDETYTWWSAHAGMEVAWQHGAHRWTLDGRLTRTLNPEVEIDAFAGFDATELDLGERWGWRTGLGWQYRISRTISSRVKAFYENWDLGRSDDAALTQNGMPVGTIFQPRIENQAYGATLELRHHW